MKNLFILSAILLSQLIFGQTQRWDTAFVSTNSPNNDIMAVCANDTEVYIGGKFTSTAGLTTNYIAKWDGFNWQIVDNSLNGEIYSLAIVNGNIVAGGNFTMAGATSINHLGIFNGTTWTTIGTGVNGPVYAIEVHDQYIYFGGLFSDVDANTTSNIAAYNLNTSSWITFPNGPDDVVYTISYKSDLYVGGAFLNCGSIATAYAATYQTGTWVEISSAFNDTVRAMEADNDGQVFIGGNFTQAYPILNDYIARYDGTTWKDAVGVDKPVHALFFGDTVMYIGGEFDLSGGKPVKKIGEWTGNGWNNLSGGMDSTVLCITMMKRDLYLGGRFSLANTNESINFARWGVSPKILTEPNSTSICEGENLSLNIDVETSVPETYQWYLDGNPIADSTNSHFIFNNADAQWSGDYYCKISNQFGTATTSTFNIEIVVPVSLNLQINDTTSCLGYNITLYVSADGTNPVYHWFKDGSQISWANDSNIVLTNIDNTDAGTYYCQILNSCDTIISTDIVLTVNDLPSVAFTGLDTEYCSSDEIDTLFGTPYGGIFTGNGITDSLFNPNSLSGTQTITYTYTDAYGCSNNSVQSTNVKLAYGVSFTGLDTYYCIENNADTLTPNRSGGTFSGNGMTDSIFNPTAAGIGTHTILYEWTNLNGCISFYSEDVTVQDPSISLGNDTSLCMGDTISLTAIGDTGNYVWSTGETTQSILVNPNIATEYSVVLHSTGGCLRYDTINVSVNSLPNVSINPLEDHYCLYGDNDTLSGTPAGGVFSGNGVSGNIFNPQSAGVGVHNIVYTYTDANACSNYANTGANVLDVNYGGVYFTGLGMEYCFYDDGVQLTGNPIGGTFSGEGVSGDIFYPEQTSGPGIYYVTYILQNDSNCGNLYSQPVKIIDFPEIIMPNDTSVCRGQNVELIVTGDEGTVEWNTGYIGDTLIFPIYYEQDLIATLTTANCHTSDTVHVYISDPRPFDMNDTSLCRLDTIVAPDGFVSYQWQENEFEGKELIILETGIYRIDVIDSFGCTNYDNVDIIVKPSPMVGFADNYTVYQEAALILGTTAGYDEYLWSNGYTGYVQTFYGDSMSIGAHTYWLYTRIGDCELSDTTIITAKNAIGIDELKNTNGLSFYPNPAKDFIVVKSEKIKISEIAIYDIKGKLIKQYNFHNFSSETIDISELEAGVYFIEINKNKDLKNKFIKE